MTDDTQAQINGITDKIGMLAGLVKETTDRLSVQVDSLELLTGDHQREIEALQRQVFPTPPPAPALDEAAKWEEVARASHAANRALQGGMHWDAYTFPTIHTAWIAGGKAAVNEAIALGLAAPADRLRELEERSIRDQIRIANLDEELTITKQELADRVVCEVPDVEAIGDILDLLECNSYVKIVRGGGMHRRLKELAAYWAAPAGAEDIPCDPWNDEAKEES